jgi:hypothetical protein
MDKLQRAESFIRSVLSSYKNPVVMSSFGKDSMCLLHILKTMKVTLPILFHREPFEPKKYAFANRIIEQEGYVCYDYPPALTQIAKVGESIEIVNRYQVGPKKFTWLGTGIKEGESGLCGLRDFYMKPTGSFNFPWDVVFVGHKSSDVDPLFGGVPLTVDIKANEGGPDYAYPLRWFTDEDVWKYTELFQVEYNDRRYDREHGYREFEDIRYNNDYYHACVNCMDRDKPATVYCPRLDCEVTNISGSLRYVEAEKPEYIGKE